jgi:hypothetical protein
MAPIARLRHRGDFVCYLSDFRRFVNVAAGEFLTHFNRRRMRAPCGAAIGALRLSSSDRLS